MNGLIGTWFTVEILDTDGTWQPDHLEGDAPAAPIAHQAGEEIMAWLRYDGQTIRVVVWEDRETAREPEGQLPLAIVTRY
jgi:hypothetical protein